VCQKPFLKKLLTSVRSDRFRLAHQMPRPIQAALQRVRITQPIALQNTADTNGHLGHVALTAQELQPLAWRVLTPRRSQEAVHGRKVRPE